MNTELLDAFLDRMPACGLHACELAVTLDGKTVYRRTVGMEENRNLYYVCSVSKVTTCVAALRLLEEGKLSLTDPVSRYLPAYADLRVKQADGTVAPARKEMTVWHLFTMTGGLNYSLKTPPVLAVAAQGTAGNEEVCNAFVGMPLDFEPGERFQYSLCHDVLAAVVEKASGMIFADYVRSFITEPLGMRDTGYHLPEELKPRMARQYRYSRNTCSGYEVELNNPYIVTPHHDSGGAGLHTTADDQLRLLTALALGGTSPDGYRVLSPETVALCERPQLSDEQMKGFWAQRLYGYNWGLCGRVHVNPAVSGGLSPVGEFGWDGATGPYALVDRKNRLAFYFGTHIYGCTQLYNQLHGQLRDLVYRTVLG